MSRRAAGTPERFRRVTPIVVLWPSSDDAPALLSVGAVNFRTADSGGAFFNGSYSVLCVLSDAWALRGRTVRCARAVRALCEKLAVLHHREFGKFRRLKGRH